MMYPVTRLSSDMMDMDMEALEYKRPRRGCFVTLWRAVVLVLLVLLLIIIVAVIVYHTRPSCENSNNNQTDSATPSAAPAVDYRLPGSLIPYHYKLHLRPDIYTGDPSTFTFSGSVQISLQCVEDTDRIVVNYDDLEISEPSITVLEHSQGANVDSLSVRNTEREHERQMYNIVLHKRLRKGHNYTVQIQQFSGRILGNLRGIYYTTYKVGEETRYALASQLQSTDARRIFPCLDEPQYKARFQVKLDRKQGKSTMSNGIIQHSTDLEDDWVTDEYPDTPVMCTYLLAFVVSDFDCRNAPSTSHVSIQICSRPNTQAQTDLAVEVAGPLQQFFEDYYNISYPMPIMRHVSVPDFASGAMENWGLILYRDYNLLYDPQASTALHEQRVITIIAHEIAHQWFGNLVSMAWWDDIWLNEGFASYMEVVGTQHVRQQWEMEDSFILSKVMAALALDSLASSHPVYQPVSSPSQITSLFDSIVYNKGASVIRMLQYFMGEQPFRRALSKYLKARSYQSTTYEDLFSFLTREARNAGKEFDVTEVMKTWILQLGYPVVKFEWNRESNKIAVSQKHFLLEPDSTSSLPESPYGYAWKVPISFVTNLDTDWNDYSHYDKWLSSSSKILDETVPAGTKWIIGNIKQRYFYRVNYDPDTWGALKQQLQDNHTQIDQKNRAQLLDDSFQLGRAQEVRQTLFLDMSTYMTKEKAYIPWVATGTGLNYLNRLLATTAHYGQLKIYAQSILRGPYQRLGWDEGDNDSHSLKKMRSFILQNACKFGLPEAVTEATRLFNNAIEQAGSGNTIPPNQLYTVYCTGVAGATLEQWDILFELYKTTNSSDMKRTLLRALACSDTYWILIRYLEIAMKEEDIRRQDFSTVFTSVAARPMGGMIAWELLADRWQTFLDRYGNSISFEYLITAATKSFSTSYHYNMVKDWVAKQSDLGSAETAFKQSMEKIRSNTVWREANLQDVTKWLNDYERGLHSGS